MSIGIFESILYGIIQGITEFLPVSSSGHLALIPHFLKTDDPGTYFDLMMHLGTALALLIYFSRQIVKLFMVLKEALIFWTPDDHLISEDKKEVFFLRNFIISTIMTVFVVLLLKKVATTYAREMPYIAANLIIFGIIMVIADHFSKNKNAENDRMRESFRLKESIIIGLSQGLAIFPGVSRSGITLTASRFLGMSRKESTEYSFFLSMPIIIAGAMLKIVESLTGVVIDQSSPQLTENLIPMLIGIFVSFAVGLLSIHFFLKIVRKIGLLYFGLYRVIFALFLYFYFIV